ncbi:MAG: PAS domain S-box protein [Bradyrhizobium sp.]|nr:MAG: PAS domain S-box protein [Bradyrhizobium sp.]
MAYGAAWKQAEAPGRHAPKTAERPAMSDGFAWRERMMDQRRKDVSDFARLRLGGQTRRPSPSWRTTRSLNWRLAAAALAVALPLIAAMALMLGCIVGMSHGADGFTTAWGAPRLMMIVTAGALVMSLALSIFIGRRLAGQVRTLQAEAEHVFSAAPVAPTPSGVREFDKLSQALAGVSKLLGERAIRQKRVEGDLKSSEERFRLLADSLPQLVWTAGPDGRIDYTNARRERYGTGALSRVDWASFIHPEDRRATAEAWLEASEAGTPYQMEHRLMAIGDGYRWHLSRAAPLSDADGTIVKWYGTTTDIHDQKLREENVKFLMTEVNHRSRNLLAVALAIARRTLTSTKTARQFEEKFSERLLGLLASQDLLIGQNWRGVPLEALVLAQVTLPAADRKKRFALTGPTVLLSPTSAQTLGLALRELFNNAVAYGAFSNDGGKVEVDWRIDEDIDEPSLDMTWRERGGPPVDPQSIRGFGSVLIEGMVAEGLHASANLEFDPAGAVWRLRAPVNEIVTRWDSRAAATG